MDTFFHILDLIADFLWSYPALFLMLSIGIWFSITTRFFQVRKFPAIVRLFSGYIGRKDEHDRGVHPLKAFFASIGGAIGIGNVVVICVAVQIGGPGAIFWTWVVGLLGMLLKYAEVYLGVKFRVKNNQGSYDGGPMFYLRKAFNVRWVAVVFAFLLCIYGVEVFMFSEITYTLSVNWHINRYFVAIPLLGLVLWSGLGGVRRVGDICSAIIPFFVVVYVFMCVWVMLHNLSAIPEAIAMIFRGAFTGQAALGGFAGATVLMAMSQGAARGSYSGDIGIGYASVIHAETSTSHPERQASLAIFGIFLDTFVVCTSSILLILITGIWSEPISAGLLVQTALSGYFPYMNIFMPFFLFLLGYSTIIAYFCVGIKCADYLHPRLGRPLFLTYAILAFIIFSFVDPSHALIIMTLCGGLLLLLNLSGIFKLRREIIFDVN